MFHEWKKEKYFQFVVDTPYHVSHGYLMVLFTIKTINKLFKSQKKISMFLNF